MTVEKAIQRIEWRFFLSSNIIFINENDLRAVSTLLDFIRSERKNTVLTNSAFSKLYVAHLNYLVKHYKSGVTDPLVFKKLHYIISRPLDYSIQELVDTLNGLEQNEFLKRCGCIETIHPKMQNPREKEQALNKLQDLLKIDSNRKKFFGKSWNFDEIKNGLEKQINYVIDDYRN